MSFIGPALTVWRVTQRPALVVSRSHGALSQRLVLLQYLLGIPCCGNTTFVCATPNTQTYQTKTKPPTRCLSPSGHNRPPQLAHGSLDIVRRTLIRSGPQGCSSTVSTFTSPNPTKSSLTRVEPDSTRILQIFRVFYHHRFWGIPPSFTRKPSNTPLQPQTRRAGLLVCSLADVLVGGVTSTRHFQGL